MRRARRSSTPPTSAAVRRTGDTSQAVTVDYATGGRLLPSLRRIFYFLDRLDHTAAAGTLRFAPGETEKSFDVLINEDSLAEGNETFPVWLSNPTGGATLMCPAASAAVQIVDDVSEPTTNAIDDPAAFVGMHYHDFLNRQADTTGLNFWTGQLTACGADEACLNRARARTFRRPSPSR